MNILVQVFVLVLIVAFVLTLFQQRISKAWLTIISLLTIAGVIVLTPTIAKDDSENRHNNVANDGTRLEHFLSGSEVPLPEINNVIGVALHSQIKLWAAKHFPPEKREEAYRAMLDEIFKTKVQLEMPASIAPYFTPTRTSDTASAPK